MKRGRLRGRLIQRSVESSLLTLSLDTCHCTVGVGVPDAAAVKVAVAPADTIWFDGLVVTAGAAVTVSVAALVVEEPWLLVKTARNCQPFCDATVLKVRVVLVAPAMFAKVAPPLLESCHWTVGVGLPVAAAVKLTLWPAVTVWSVGFVVTVGADWAHTVPGISRAHIAATIAAARPRRRCGAETAEGPPPLGERRNAERTHKRAPVRLTALETKPITAKNPPFEGQGIKTLRLLTSD